MAAIGRPPLTTVLYNPDGTIANVPTLKISDTDAALLRKYKKLLLKYRLREALYCQDCWNGSRHDGCEAHVTDSDILIKCRCTIRVHLGQSF